MLLELKNVHAGYGPVKVLFGISLQVAEGEAIGLVGRNGMGRTTTVNAIMGICPPTEGEVHLHGRRVDTLSCHRIPKLGVGLVPEGRRIFPNLTVRENLMVAARVGHTRHDPWTLSRVLKFFPRLGERLENGGNQLSGGEQQMLAIGRALMTNPSLLILDEATEGLAPLIRQEIWDVIATLKRTGMSMIIIDKEVEAISKVAQRQYIVEKGRIVWEGTSESFLRDTTLQEKYLSLGE